METQSERIAQASAPRALHDGSYADWSAIMVGAVIAAGTASVFTTFGTGLGLSSISPYSGEGSALAAMLGVGLWMIWTTVSSVMVGGYVAGRMRRRVDATTADDVAIRDGIHGLAVWGVTILLGALLIGLAADATAANTVSTAAAAPLSDAAARLARNYSVASSFVASASLFIGAAGAYWAAEMGGRHRNENKVFARFGVWI